MSLAGLGWTAGGPLPCAEARTQPLGDAAASDGIGCGLGSRRRHARSVQANEFDIVGARLYYRRQHRRPASLFVPCRDCKCLDTKDERRFDSITSLLQTMFQASRLKTSCRMWLLLRQTYNPAACSSAGLMEHRLPALAAACPDSWLLRALSFTRLPWIKAHLHPAWPACRPIDQYSVLPLECIGMHGMYTGTYPIEIYCICLSTFRAVYRLLTTAGAHRPGLAHR